MKITAYLLSFMLLVAFSNAGELLIEETKFPLPEKRPSNVAELFRTAENLEIIKQPDRVEVCILNPDLAPGEEFTDKTKEGPYKLVPAESAKWVSAKLAGNESYLLSQEEKDCLPLYNARVRFSKGADTITADLCFGCKIMRFSRDNTVINLNDFDPIDSDLFEYVRALFPDDKVVLSIIDQRKRSTELKRLRDEQRAKEKAAFEKAKFDRAAAKKQSGAETKP